MRTSSALDDLISAKGCGNALVGDQGMLEFLLVRIIIHRTSSAVPDSRKHHVEWDTKLLCNMNMCEARRIGNNGICDKMIPAIIMRQSLRKVQWFVSMGRLCWTKSITSFVT